MRDCTLFKSKWHQWWIWMLTQMNHSSTMEWKVFQKKNTTCLLDWLIHSFLHAFPLASTYHPYFIQTKPNQTHPTTIHIRHTLPYSNNQLYVSLPWITLPETSSLPLKIGPAPKGNNRIPTIHFQERAVTSSAKKLWNKSLKFTFPLIPAPSKGCQLNPKGCWIDTL